MFSKKGIPLSKPAPVFVRAEQNVSQVDEHGNVIEKVIYEKLDSTDPDNFPILPSVEEYSLSNLLNAGVPLEQIPVGSLLGSDSIDQDNVNSIIEQLKNISE